MELYEAEEVLRRTAGKEELGVLQSKLKKPLDKPVTSKACLETTPDDTAFCRLREAKEPLLCSSSLEEITPLLPSYVSYVLPMRLDLKPVLSKVP